MRELTERERREAVKWVTRMLDQPDRHRAGLEAWVGNRPERLAEYNRLLDGVQDLARSAEARKGDERPAVRRASSWRIRTHEFGWRPALAVAAVFLMVLALGAQLVGNDLLSGGAADGISIRIATRVGEVRPEKLSDGTKVTLDTGTTLDVQLTGDGRTVVLRHGRARFEVASGEGRPDLTVIGRNNRVIVKSGVFDVSDRDEFAAQVVEGDAVVQLRPAVYLSTTEPDIRLAAGQKVVVSGLQSAPASAIAARPSDAQWIGGVKSFNDVPIREVIAEANTYSETKIVLADPALGQRGIFGDLYIRDVEAVATGVASFLHLEVDRSQPGKLILVARN